MILPPLAVRSHLCFDQRLSLTLVLCDLNAASNGDVDDNFPVAISWSKHSELANLVLFVCLYYKAKNEYKKSHN